MTERTWTVYALVDSRYPEDIRYIGISCRPRKRLHNHVNGSSEANHRSHWIRSVVGCGAEIRMVVLMEGLSVEEAKTNEVELIAYHRTNGTNLVNSTAGGDGVFDPTPEVRAKISARFKGRTLSAETRQKIGAAFRGKKLTVEHRVKVSAGLRGKRKSAEHVAKVVAAQIGKTLTDEHRAKLSAAARNRSPETRAIMADAQRGKTLSDETRAKMSAAHKGKKFTDERRANMSLAQRKRLS